VPLSELWDETGTLLGERVRHLDENLIGDILRTVPVQFIVADCGVKLNWIPTQERFEFWKTIRPHIADPMKPIQLDRFPNQVACTASEWRGRTGECLILLEKRH
jgi:hypothetical protein